MIAGARDGPRNNLLFCLTFSFLTLPKKSAFGKVTCMGKRRLLPQMTASLYLGQMGALDGQRIALVVGHAIGPTGKRHRLTLQQPLDNSDRLRQPRYPGTGRIEAQPRLVVFGSHVSGAQAELKSAIGQEVDRRRLT